MVREELTNKEIVERGKRIYDEKLRVQMERDHRGQFIAVDIFSGDYAVGRKDIDAINIMRAKRPDAIVFIARIGQEAAYTFGAGILGRNA